MRFNHTSYNSWNKRYRAGAATWKMSKEEAEMNTQTQQSLGARWAKIAGVVALYWVISISMVFINKYLLSSADLKLDAPFFITLSQCIVAYLSFTAMGLVSLYSPNTISFPAFELNIHTALKVMPLSVVFVGMIVFNNLTLKYLGIAFYNVGRSLTTVFNVGLSYAILGQSTSLRAISCCGVIVSGFLLGLKEENQSITGTISWFGVSCGVLASLCVALYAIFTKKVLKVVEENIWRLQYYNNMNAVLLLTVAVFIAERDALAKFQFWTSLYFWFLMLMAGLFGIAIGYVTSLQIQVTSPLTHNVSGTAKACAQTILACLVYSETKPFWWWMSNVMVLGGSSGYTYVKMEEMRAQQQEKKQSNTLVVIEAGESEG